MELSCSLSRLESCNDECSSWFYKTNDLPAVVKALVSSPYLYHEIITAICKHWNLTHGIGGPINDLDSRSYSTQSAFPEKWLLPIGRPAPSEALTKDEDSTDKRPGEKSTLTTHSCNIETETSGHVNLLLDTGKDGINMKNRLLTSEGSEEASSSLDSRGIRSEVPRETHYINFYEFARTASSVLEELTSKSSDKSSEGTMRSVEDISPGEMKVISNKFAEFSWSNMQNIRLNSRKEKCGWCLYCKVPEDGRDCILIVNDSTPAVENFTSEVLGIKSAKNRKNHLIDVICHVTYIEDRLQGLLSGPWLNPHYSQLWRGSVLEAVEVGSLKNLLLQLESNLHHLALSVDWRKHVDSVATMGSASHIVRSTARVSLKLATGGKRGKCSKMEITPTSNAKAGLRLFWWRGGRASRELFNYKVLPRSLTSKAARQGGCKKILGIHYPDNGEYAKRMRYVAWRAAVETSRSVPQLALQVRELNANIRWTDIENCSLLTKMEKKSRKPIKSFKNVSIRAKQCEGQVVKYLLDFGKKRFIPDIVVKHGSLLQDSSSERKKYWLDEMHVPLHLLKAFEARRIARKSNKIISGELCEISAAMKKPFNKKGFPYLFSKAEKSETCQCGHCNRDIHISKAVSCQNCKGFFHKKHARESAGSSLAVSVYTCYKCENDNELVQTGAMEGKSELTLKEALMALCSGKEKKRVNSKKKGVPLVVKVRNSAKTAERVSPKLPLQNKKGKKEKKGKEAKPEKGELKKRSRGTWKKKRIPVRSSYWLNGLRLSRRENDERLVQFRSKMLLLLSGEEDLIRHKPKCSLCCEIKYSPKLNYVACEICGVWFHSDAVNLGADKIKNVIGFKCHNCLNKKPPVCPHHGSNKAELVPENNAESKLVTEDSKDILLTFNFEKQKSSGKRLKRKKLAFYERILLENDSVEVGGNS